MQELQTLDPPYQVELADYGWKERSLEVIPGWRLVGYDLPGAPFISLWDELEIVLYWERDPFVAIPGEIQVGNWRLI